MAISKLNIDNVDYNLQITELEDILTPNIIEKNLIPNMQDLDTDNSIIYSTSKDRRRISISGYCTNADKLVFRNAYITGLKIRPTIYHPLGENNLTPYMYFYITKFNSTYKIGSSECYYQMELTFASTIDE